MGVAAAKALGSALGVPVVPVSSLDVLAAAARRAPRAPVPRVVVPVVDMRRGEVAWSMAAPGAGPDEPPGTGLGPPGALAGALADVARSGSQVLLVGDGAERHRDELAGLLEGAAEVRFGGDELAAPPVAELAALALAALGEGGGVPATDVRPNYLREADVKINWSSRHDRSAP